MKSRTKDLKKWISKKKLDEKIQDKKLEAKVLRKLMFIRHLYEGKSVPDAADEVGVTKGTGYNWLEEWNEDEFDIERLKPDYDGGPKPKLDYDQRDKLKEMLKERNDWTKKEISNLIEDEFDVSYSDRHLNRILKDLGMNCSKPYQQDYRRPDDAEEKLKKTD